MSWHHGNCRSCGERSEDDICPRCDARFEAEREAEENMPVRRHYPQTHVSLIPTYEPGDPF